MPLFSDVQSIAGGLNAATRRVADIGAAKAESAGTQKPGALFGEMFGKLSAVKPKQEPEKTTERERQEEEEREDERWHEDELQVAIARDDEEEPAFEPEPITPPHKRVFKQRFALPPPPPAATPKPASDTTWEEMWAEEDSKRAQSPTAWNAPSDQPPPPVAQPRAREPEPSVRPAGPVLDLSSARSQPPKRVNWNSSVMRERLSIDHGEQDGGWDDTWADKLGVYEEDE